MFSPSSRLRSCLSAVLSLWRRPVRGAVLLLPLVLLACQSSRGTGEGGHASATVPGRTVDDVRVVTAAVFREHGYALHQSLPQELVFQRGGSGGDALMYGGWGDAVVQRVRVRFYTTGETGVQAVATVYVVRDAGDRVMEEESRKFMMNRGWIKDLMAEVEKRSAAAAPAAAPAPR